MELTFSFLPISAKGWQAYLPSKALVNLNGNSERETGVGKDKKKEVRSCYKRLGESLLKSSSRNADRGWGAH